MPSNTPSTDAAHQAASGSTQAANAPISTRGSMSAMMQVMQTRTLVTPVVQSKAGGSVPALNMPIGPGGLRETAQALTSMSNPSPAIHGLPSEPLLSVRRPQTSIPPLPMMYSRMSAPLPHALAVRSEPIALTSSASKVKAPTISEIHVVTQWAITRFSTLAPFDTDEWDSTLF